MNQNGRDNLGIESIPCLFGIGQRQRYVNPVKCISICEDSGYLYVLSLIEIEKFDDHTPTEIRLEEPELVGVEIHVTKISQ